MEATEADLEAGEAVVAKVAAAVVAVAVVAVAAAGVARVGLVPALAAQADVAAVRGRERRVVLLDPKAAPAAEMMVAEVSSGPAGPVGPLAEELEAQRAAILGAVRAAASAARRRRRDLGEIRSKVARLFVSSCLPGIDGSMRS